MSLQSSSKINQIMQSWSSGTVSSTRWLKDMGVSRQLINKYKKSGWIEAIGSGAFKKSGDSIDYTGAIYAMQYHDKLSIHPGGRTSLSLQGKAHYLEVGGKQAYLYRAADEKIPAWFRNYDWGIEIKNISTSFLPPTMELVDLEIKNYSIQISSPVRAILECLHQAYNDESILECYQLMENLNNLNPKNIQTMLENCSSVKVKRLFLFMADDIGHSWFKYIELGKIDIGRGKRNFSSNGIYIDKYKINIPKNLRTDNESRI